MKRLFLMILFFAGTLWVSAYDYSYLSVQTADGTIVQVSVESLVLSVEEGKLVVANTNGEKSFLVEDLTKMYFSEKEENDITGIMSAGKENTGIDVYTVSGVYLGSFGTRAELSSQLGKGIYVIKQNERTYKIAVK